MPPTAATGVRIKVLYFAKARELADGVSDEVLTFAAGDQVNLGMVLEECTRLHVKLQTLISADGVVSTAMAVNMEYVDASSRALRILDGDEVAFIPPISGG